MTAMTFDRPIHRPAGPPAAAPSRLTRRGRLVLVLVLAAVALVAFSLGRTSATASRDAVAPPRATVVVQPGETLWEIASRVAPGTDPRVTVGRIRELNGLRGAPQAGQRLQLPR